MFRHQHYRPTVAAATDNNSDHRATKAAIVAARCRRMRKEGSACSCPSQQPDEVGSFSIRQPQCRERPSGTATPARTQGRFVPCFGGHLQGLREVTDQHICSNSCAGFAADTCSGPFKRPTWLSYLRCRTEGKLRHNHPTHPTGFGSGSGRGQRQRESEAAK